MRMLLNQGKVQQFDQWQCNTNSPVDLPVTSTTTPPLAPASNTSTDTAGAESNEANVFSFGSGNHSASISNSSQEEKASGLFENQPPKFPATVQTSSRMTTTSCTTTVTSSRSLLYGTSTSSANNSSISNTITTLAPGVLTSSTAVYSPSKTSGHLTQMSTPLTKVQQTYLQGTQLSTNTPSLLQPRSVATTGNVGSPRFANPLLSVAMPCGVASPKPMTLQVASTSVRSPAQAGAGMTLLRLNTPPPDGMTLVGNNILTLPSPGSTSGAKTVYYLQKTGSALQTSTALLASSSAGAPSSAGASNSAGAPSPTCALSCSKPETAASVRAGATVLPQGGSTEPGPTVLTLSLHLKPPGNLPIFSVAKSGGQTVTLNSSAAANFKPLDIPGELIDHLINLGIIDSFHILVYI